MDSQKSPIKTRIVTLLRILAQLPFPQYKTAKKNSPIASRRTEFDQMATKSQRSQAVFNFGMALRSNTGSCAPACGSEELDLFLSVFSQACSHGLALLAHLGCFQSRVSENPSSLFVLSGY